MNSVKKAIVAGLTALFAAILMIGCAPQPNGETGQASGQNSAGAGQNSTGAGQNSIGNSAYAVKITLAELTEVDPEKGIGVYGRYTQLTAEGEVPEAFAQALAEANARAKEIVETKARDFLAENSYPIEAPGSAVTEQYRYRNISYIVNVTRADDALFCILETEMESGIGDVPGESIDGTQSCVFHSSVYDTQSGKILTLGDFLQDPGSIQERLAGALENKYGFEGLYTPAGEDDPVWTADYLGLRFYFDGEDIPAEIRREHGMDADKAIHVSIPYTALDGPLAETAAGTPESFIAQIEKNTDYALPHDERVIRVEKAEDPDGNEAYSVVIKDGGNEEAWQLEYADDDSDYYVFRAQGSYYFYRLEDDMDWAYVYNFASPDGGFGRFENQNAQCFDSYMHELCLAVPYDPECVHMRERSRRFMDMSSGLNTALAPNGHYSFLPDNGRGRTWLHFALTDDALALDTRDVGCRMLHKISAAALNEQGKESGETVVPEGEVLRFLRTDGESELYYFMLPQYRTYSSGGRDYFYDCELSDGSEVRIAVRGESNFFVDGMYLSRIAEPVTLGAAQYEAGSGGPQDHYVEIAGKEYKLIQDLSLPSETGEEIDFGSDTWWIVENYVGTFSSEEEDAKLVISESGEVDFDYQGRSYTGKLSEKRYYQTFVEASLESEGVSRLFSIILMDELPIHDPSFNRIDFYSEGLPATNEPSDVPPIEVDLVREQH